MRRSTTFLLTFAIRSSLIRIQGQGDLPTYRLPPAFRKVRAMFDLHTGRSTDCSGLSRRSFLRVGGLSALGLSLSAYLRLQSLQAAPARKNVNCILLWMQGDPS